MQRVSTALHSVHEIYLRRNTPGEQVSLIWRNDVNEQRRILARIASDIHVKSFSYFLGEWGFDLNPQWRQTQIVSIISAPLQMLNPVTSDVVSIVFKFLHMPQLYFIQFNHYNIKSDYSFNYFDIQADI